MRRASAFEASSWLIGGCVGQLGNQLENESPVLETDPAFAFLFTGWMTTNDAKVQRWFLEVNFVCEWVVRKQTTKRALAFEASSWLIDWRLYRSTGEVWKRIEESTGDTLKGGLFNESWGLFFYLLVGLTTNNDAEFQYRIFISYFCLRMNLLETGS